MEGLQAGPQVTEGEGGDVTDSVVLEGQFTEKARQIHRDSGELVVGQVQGFQGPEKKRTEESFIFVDIYKKTCN